MSTLTKSPPPAQITPWISIAEAAERLGVSTKTIRRMITRGELEARRFGPRIIRVAVYALDDAGRPLQYVDGGVS